MKDKIIEEMNIKCVHVNIQNVSHYGKPAVRIAFTKGSGTTGIRKRIYVGKLDLIEKVLTEEFHTAGKLTTDLRITGNVEHPLWKPGEYHSVDTVQRIEDELIKRKEAKKVELEAAKKKRLEDKAKKAEGASNEKAEETKEKEEARSA